MPTKIKVLIVDDEINLTNALELFLGDAGYVVHVANDGKKAKELIVDYRYDLVLLDLNMPGIDGIRVAQFLKQKWPTLPIIVITGFRGEYEGKLKELKIHEYVMDKPLGLLDLAKKMKQILGPIEPTETKKTVPGGIPKAKLLFIEHHDALYSNLFSPYFNALKKSEKACYELVFSQDNANVYTLLRIYQPDIIILNTDAMGIYPELKKELRATSAILKEVVVHGRELRYKKPGELGLDAQLITAIEGGDYEEGYAQRLEEAVREICYRFGLVEEPKNNNKK